MMSDITPGDPLSTPQQGQQVPGLPGYTTPPPPGAGGLAPPPASPEPGAGQFVLAGWWKRVGATLVDGLILVAGALLILLLFGTVFSVGFFAGDEVGIVSVIVGLLLAFVALAIVSLLYAPTLMSRTNGQTWGRQLMGIRVVRTSGEPITFGFAVIREVVLKWLVVGVVGAGTIGIFVLIDYLWPLWDEENRALHDFPVQTRTVLA